MIETDGVMMSARGALEGLSVLVVDDAPGFRAAIAAMARRLGGVVASVDTVEQGSAALLAGGVDLAIVDVGLPDGSGGVLLAEALARGERAALLARSAEHDAAAAPEADIFVPKPFESLAAFRRATTSALAIRGLRLALAEAAGSPAAQAALAAAAARFRRAAALGSPQAFDDAAHGLAVAAQALGLSAISARAGALAHVSDGPRAAARLATLCARAAAG